MEERGRPAWPRLGLPLVALVLIACRGEPPAPLATGSGRPASGAVPRSTGTTGGAPSSPAATPSGSPGAAGAERSAPAATDAAGLATIDLGAGGDAWQGLVGKAPAGTVVRDDGTGSVLLALPGGRPIVLAPGGSRAMAEQRLGAASAARVAGATLTFETDRAEEIAYVLDLEDLEGAPLRTHGFAVAREVGGSRFVCAFSSAEDEAELETARAVCASITR